MPSNWESSGRVKIERAKEHIDNLHAQAAAFFKGGGYRIAVEADAQSGQQFLCIRGGPIPIRWSAIASDAIHNLRSSLDYLWRQVMYPGGGGTKRKGGFFPIEDGAELFETRHGREVKSSRKAAMELVRSFKPYKNGNDPLWALDAIDKRDKHEILSLACADLLRAKFAVWRGTAGPPPPDTPPAFGIEQRSDVPFDPLEDGTRLFRVDGIVPPDMNVKAQLSFGVAFGKGEILEGKSVEGALNKFASVVDGIIEAFLRAGLLR